MSMLQTLKKIGISFIALLVFYVASLTLVSCISNESVQTKLYESVDTIQAEDNTTGWVHPYFERMGTSTDNGTDLVMMDRNVIDESKSPLYNAMNQREYARYWHGYQIFLRPMLLFMNMENIRVVNMVIFFSLLVVVLVKLKERLGYSGLFSLLIPMIMAYLFVIPLSMQYMNTFVIAFIGILLVISFEDKGKKDGDYYWLFFVLGSVVNFFDFLTTPLITLGLPLIVLMLLKSKEDTFDLISNLIFLVLMSVSWGLGYGLTWIAKWIIGSLVLGRNILQEATSSASIWTGNTEFIVEPNRILALKRNFLEMFHNKVIFVIHIALVIISLIKTFFSHNQNKMALAIVLLIIMLYPIAWYIVMPSHGLIHYYMTYRTLLIFYFASLSLIFNAWIKTRRD